MKKVDFLMEQVVLFMNKVVFQIVFKKHDFVFDKTSPPSVSHHHRMLFHTRNDEKHGLDRF